MKNALWVGIIGAIVYLATVLQGILSEWQKTNAQLPTVVSDAKDLVHSIPDVANDGGGAFVEGAKDKLVEIGKETVLNELNPKTHFIDRPKELLRLPFEGKKKKDLGGRGIPLTGVR